MLLSPGWAATVSLQAQVDELEVGQVAQIQVVVVDTARAELPVFPEQEGLELRFAGQAQRFESSMQRGIVRTVSFRFLVEATREGSYTLGPATVKLPGGEELRTNTLVLRVKPRAPAGEPVRDLELEAGFTRDQAWEGEVVLYRAALRARVTVGNVSWKLPTFKGFSRPAHGDVVNQTVRIGDPDGDITLVEGLVPLVASATGELRLPPALARVDVLTADRGLFGLGRRRRRSVVSESGASLRVRPLPPPPADFSGLVGDFEVRSRLAADRATVGETVRWTVEVLGDGVVDGFDLPAHPVEGARVYRDDVQVTGGLVDGRYLGRKTFRLELVPTRPGSVEIPPLEVVVFAPEEGRYRRLRVEAGALRVTGEAEQSELKSFGRVDGAEVEAPPEPVDIEPIYTWGFGWAIPNAPAGPVMLLVLSIPGGLVLMGEGGMALRAWWGRRSGRGAAPMGAARLRALPADPQERLATLDRALREALAARVGVELGALRRSEALGQLPEGLRHRVENAFAALDRCRFAGVPASVEVETMVRDAVARLG